ncbi:MAG: ATP-binding protein [Bryobacteraceae bacterium]
MLQSNKFKLFCGYPIDIFADDFRHSQVDAVVCAHTHVVATGENGDLQAAMARAIEEVAGTNTIELESLALPTRYPKTRVPVAEAAILGLHTNFPERGREIIGTARRYFQGEKRFRALIENGADAISLFDLEGNFTYASASTARVLGYQPHHLVGRNVFELIHPDDLETLQRTLEEARTNTRYPVQIRARVLAKDAQWRWVEDTFTNLIDDPDVRAIVANYRDITEQAGKNLEQAIQESGASIIVGPLPCVLGNESQLTGLMQNLLGNAIKYRGAEALRIEVTAELAGTECVIKVQDNGIGIAPAYHEQIFGLFKRLHERSVPGTGIGLAICKKIVEGMGGRIWVESEPGRGSIFCFTAQSAAEG